MCVEELECENSGFREDLLKYQTPKNRRNSSMPPSKDEKSPVEYKKSTGFIGRDSS
jgi:hypothetical protein